MRVRRLAIWLVAGVVSCAAGFAVPAEALEHPATGRMAAPTEVSAQTRRAPPRIRVYRRVRALPSDAVRECHAWYVQEHRPSGTVIVPRMQCWWTR